MPLWGGAVTVLPPLHRFPLWLFLRTDIPLPSPGYPPTPPTPPAPASTLCVSLLLRRWCLSALLTAGLLCLFLSYYFCWQKLHWWKLTCKVDSSVCLIQSLIPHPPSPSSLSASVLPLTPPSAPFQTPPTLSTSPEQDDCLVLNSPSKLKCETGLQSHRNTSSTTVLY